MTISVVNRCARLHEAALHRVLHAINRQLAEHVEPAWRFGARLELHAGGVAPAHGGPVSLATLPGVRGDGVIYVTDHATVAEAEGYHDRNNADIPFGFVFVDVCEQQGDAWSVALSHEAIELVGDPLGNLLVEGPAPHDGAHQVFHVFELCDPVTDETYEIDGVAVSNFVLPAYFAHGRRPGAGTPAKDPRTDYLGRPPGQVLAPLGTTPGGYLQFYDPRRAGDKWTDYTAPGDAVAVRRLATRKALRQARVARRAAVRA